MFLLVKLILLHFISSHFIQSFVSFSFLARLAVPNIVTNLLDDTRIPTSPVLVLFLVDLMKIEIVITSPLRMVMHATTMNASSLVLSTILVMSYFVLVMLLSVNVVGVVNINSVPSSSSNAVVISTKMIVPPIIDWIKKSLHM